MSPRSDAIEAALRQAQYAMQVHPTADAYVGAAQMLASSARLAGFTPREVAAGIASWAAHYSNLEDNYRPRALPGDHAIRRFIDQVSEPEPGEPEEPEADYEWGTWRPKGSHPLFVALHAAFSHWCQRQAPAWHVRVASRQVELTAYQAQEERWRRWLPRSSDELRRRATEGEVFEAHLRLLKEGQPLPAREPVAGLEGF